jgi:group I intron endonuclease
MYKGDYMTISGIYKIQNTLDGRTYYGSSKDIAKRLKDHKRELVANRHHNLFLQRAWNKDGSDNFEFSFVEEVSRDNLLVVEQTYLDDNKGGYNLAPANGGDIISKHPERKKIIAKMRKSIKLKYKKLGAQGRKEKYGRLGTKNGNWRNGGISKKLCPICSINKTRSTNNSCGDCRDRTGKNNSFYGKEHSKETKDKISLANSGVNSGIAKLKPEEIPYTKLYEIIWPCGQTAQHYGLDAIAKLLDVTMACISLIVKRGRPNTRGGLKGISILEIKRP